MFATILAFCEPSDSLSLCNEYKSIFVSDIRLRHRGRATVLQEEKNALSYVLLEVRESMKLMVNFTLDIFQLPSPQENLPALLEEEGEHETDSERLRRAADEAGLSLTRVRELFSTLLLGLFFPVCLQAILNLLSRTNENRAVENPEFSSWMLHGEPGKRL